MQISKKHIFGGLIAILAIVFIACLGRIGEDVRNEQIVVNQYPFTGEMEYWTTPGFKWQWFGKTTHYYKTNQVWFNNISSNDRGDLTTYGLENTAFPIKFEFQINDLFGYLVGISFDLLFSKKTPSFSY